jgi:hypothetical protein
MSSLYRGDPEPNQESESRYQGERGVRTEGSKEKRGVRTEGSKEKRGVRTEGSKEKRGVRTEGSKEKRGEDGKKELESEEFC